MFAPILSLVESPLELEQGPEPKRELLQKKLERLREISGVLKAPLSRDALPFSQVSGGIPRSALTEVSSIAGGGKTELALRFIAENPSLRVAWIEDRLTAYPSAFPQLGVELSRLLFIEGGKDTLWAAHQAIRSQLFGIVVISAASLATASSIELRRLQLSAEHAHCPVILLSEKSRASGNWPFALQIQVPMIASRTSRVDETAEITVKIARVV